MDNAIGFECHDFSMNLLDNGHWWGSLRAPDDGKTPLCEVGVCCDCRLDLGCSDSGMGLMSCG